MSRILRVGLGVCLALGVACLAAGCGDDGGDGTGSTAEGGGATGGTGGTGGTEPQEPSLTLAAEEDSVRLVQGTSALVTVTASRINFEGDVSVEAHGLPDSVSANALVLGATQSSGDLEVSALATAAHGGPYSTTLHATAVDHPEVVAETTVTLHVAGPPGSLDESFSYDGTVEYKVTDSDYDTPQGFALDSQRRIVVCGEGQGNHPWVGWVVRFLPDGSIDPDFADSGELHGFGQPESSVRDLVTLDDDTLVVLAAQWDDNVPPNNFYLRRYTQDGAIDTSFGTSGDTVFPNEVFGRMLKRTTSGILVQHHYADPPVMSRYSQDGVHDSSFALTPTPASHVALFVVDSTDRILTGHAGGSAIEVQRYSSDGVLDTGFGAGGTVQLPVPNGHDSPYVLALDTWDDGSGVALTRTNFGTIYENDVKAYGFAASGILNSAFGLGGSVDVALGGGADAKYLPDGSIVVAGSDYEGGNSHSPFLLKLLPDGQPDSQFGTAGRVDIEGAGALLVDEAAGRVLVLSVASGTTGGILIQRYWL